MPQKIAERVAARYAAMSPEKLKELMLKLRKGADASVSMNPPPTFLR